MHRAFVSLGSNIAPERHLPAAVRALQRLGEVRRISRVWQSAPVGDEDQPDFCNAAVLLETQLDAAELCEQLRRFEAELGRVRDPMNKNAPRTIDLDLALFDQDVIESGSRTIPDPDIVTRAFIAVPLAELEPDYVHPVERRTLRSIAETVGEYPPLFQRDDIALPVKL